MKTLIINAHPDPYAAEAATNRMDFLKNKNIIRNLLFSTIYV